MWMVLADEGQFVTEILFKRKEIMKNRKVNVSVNLVKYQEKDVRLNQFQNRKQKFLMILIMRRMSMAAQKAIAWTVSS